MATFTVTTNKDVVDANDGVLSLREAVAAANAAGGADTINFAANVFTGGDASFIRLTLGEIGISGAVTIDGSTATGVTISGDKNGNDTVVAGTHITDVAASGGTLADNSRIFNISSTTAATTLDSLTLTGGHTTALGGSGIGGAVKSNADLTIIDSVITGNSTTGDFAIGGAIYGRTTVTLNATTVSDNSTAGTNAFGGGVYSSSTVILTDSTVSNNSTTGSASSGGGIAAITAVGSAEVVTLTNSTVSNNSTATDDSDGGGIYSNGSVTLTGSTVSGNSTTGDGADGGGISSITVTLTDSTVSGNSITGSSASGGGIFGTDVTLTSSTIYGNSIVSGLGGGVMGTHSATLLNSTVSGNAVLGSGSDAAGVFGLSLTLTNSILVGNQGLGSSDPDFNTANLNVNGANIIGATSNAGVPGFIIADATKVFAQTTDIGGGVLAGVLANNGGPVQTIALKIDANLNNPALDASNSSAPTLDAAGNARFDLPGVANVNGSAADLGAVEAKELPSLVVTTTSDVVNAFDGVTSLREAIAYANSHAGADTITFDASVFTGGAASLIRLTQGQINIFDAVTIDGSTATGVTITGDKNGDDVLVAGTNITDVAASYGGTPGAASDHLDDNSRIFNISFGTADTTLSGLTLTGGRTTFIADLGGAIRSSGALTLADCTLSGNSTQGDLSSGGAIVSSHSLTLNGTTVSDNSTAGAKADGGGIFSFASVTLISSSVSGNSTGGASASGGGIAADSSVFGNNLVVTLKSSTVSDNSTAGIDANGGGIFVAGTGSTVTATDSTVSGNSTVGTNADGGGIFNNGTVSLINSTVTGNSAKAALADGGGIDGGTVTLTNSIVLGNDSALATADELRGNISANGLNIVGANATAFDTTGISNVINADPTKVFAQTVANGATFAGVLADNGGNVPTVALKADVTNPALDASDGSAPALDERGTARQDLLVGHNGSNFADLGAFELTAKAPVISLANVHAPIRENVKIAAAVHVADIVVADPDSSDALSLSGADSALFSIVGNQLFLKAGAVLDFETNPTLDVTVEAHDPLVSGSFTTSLSLGVVDTIDDIRGTPGPDVLVGHANAERLLGFRGNDRLFGGGGNDLIIAGHGVDIMNGGAGDDTFVFRSVYQSRGASGFVNGVLDPASGAGKRDIITDFTQGHDKIDLSFIDADVHVTGNQAFAFAGKANMTTIAGSLIYRAYDEAGTSHDKTIIYGDNNGDGKADFQIELKGLLNLHAGDFVL